MFVPAGVSCVMMCLGTNVQVAIGVARNRHTEIGDRMVLILEEHKQALEIFAFRLWQERETAELLNLLEDKGELEKKTREAVAVLNAHTEAE